MKDDQEIVQGDIEQLKKDCIEICSNATAKELSFYFVVRCLKEGKRSTDRGRMMDKYDFSLYRVCIDTLVSAFLYDCISNNIRATLQNDKIEIKEYEVIGDDTGDFLYTYSLNNYSVFKSIIDLLKDTGKINDLTDLKLIREDIFAYCISMEYNNKLFYSFRRIYPGNIKIVTTKPKNALQSICAFLGPNDKTLRIQNGDSIQLDNKIDCLFIGNKFFVIQKKSFESLLGLENEFQEEARNVVTSLIASEIISFDEKDLIDTAIGMQSIFKILASVKKKGNEKWVKKDNIKKLARLHKKMTGKDLELKDGRIRITTVQDLKNLAKLLNDFYKKGLTTKKLYGSNAGTILKPQG